MIIYIYLRQGPDDRAWMGRVRLINRLEYFLEHLFTMSTGTDNPFQSFDIPRHGRRRRPPPRTPTPPAASITAGCVLPFQPPLPPPLTTRPASCSASTASLRGPPSLMQPSSRVAGYAGWGLLLRLGAAASAVTSGWVPLLQPPPQPTPPQPPPPPHVLLPPTRTADASAVSAAQ